MALLAQALALRDALGHVCVLVIASNVTTSRREKSELVEKAM
jgi:hypothetical protein